MKDLMYSGKPGDYKLEVLMDELVELLAPSGIVPYVQGAPDGSWVQISLPDGVSEQAIEQVVAAHDPGVVSKAEQVQVAVQASEAALAALDIEGLKTDTLAAKDLSEIQAVVLKLIEAIEQVLIATGRK
jgi:hypothetical protein